MTQGFMKIILLTIFLFSVVFQQIYSKDSLLTNTDDYRLFYVGRDATLAELKSKYVSFTIFINIPLDSSFYRMEYPNPFSPPSINQKFIYQISDAENIQIILIDTQDSILLSLSTQDQIEGYYYFIVKSSFFLGD